MDPNAVSAEAEVMETHWWFTGRRRLFGREIRRLGIDKDEARVLDVGINTGTNLKLLTEMGFENIVALEPNATAIDICRARNYDNVRYLRGDATRLPLKGGSLDLVLATDVLEHIEDDARALREIRDALKPGGVALITVPTFQSLWGHQDVVSHHLRRYRKSEMVALTEEAGLETLSSYYFNFMLFLPIYLTRRFLTISGAEARILSHKPRGN